jgi:hypothetical protein
MNKELLLHLERNEYLSLVLGWILSTLNDFFYQTFFKKTNYNYMQ